MKVPTLAILAVSLALAGGVVAFAQDADVSEVVVTGSRMQDYEPTMTPYVSLKRRADNLITTVKVVCDTRDPVQRKAELTATLKALIKSAAAAGIELGIEDEDIVGKFDTGALDDLINPDTKPDTSYATVTLKTKVLPTDTLDSATDRIERFIEKTPKTGRTEILQVGDWNLTLIGPERYRAEFIALVSADAKKTAAAFGEGYTVRIEGLTLPMTWYQSGPLELALYIPYKQTIDR